MVPSHQGNHAGQRQRGGAEHRGHGGKNFHAHEKLPRRISSETPQSMIRAWERQSPDWRLLRNANQEIGVPRGDLMQAGPVVRHKNRIAGIGRIVLHAGGLAGSDALEAQALFKARNVLRGFVRDAGNGIAVPDQAAQTVSGRLRMARPCRSEDFAGSDAGAAGPCDSTSSTTSPSTMRPT